MTRWVASVMGVLGFSWESLKYGQTQASAWVLLFPPLAYGLGVYARGSGTVSLGAAWVVKLPCFDLGLLVRSAWYFSVGPHIFQNQLTVGFARIDGTAARFFINQNFSL